MDKAVKQKSYSKPLPAAQHEGVRKRWFSEVNRSKEKDENKRKEKMMGGKAEEERVGSGG